MGETAEAERFLQESLTLTQKIGYRWGVGNALDGLGVLAQKSNPHEARKLFAAGSDIYREIGDLRSLTRALCHQGYNSLALDDIPEAQKSFTEALRLARQCDYISYTLEALAGFASLYTKQGNKEQALELLLVVLNHPAILSSTKDRAAHLRAELEAQLTLSQVKSIQTQAGEKTFESVVEDWLT